VLDAAVEELLFVEDVTDRSLLAVLVEDDAELVALGSDLVEDVEPEALVLITLLVLEADEIDEETADLDSDKEIVDADVKPIPEDDLTDVSANEDKGEEALLIAVVEASRVAEVIERSDIILPVAESLVVVMDAPVSDMLAIDTLEEV
jgi:hypothetical protein